MDTTRRHDLVLVGATGFVGALTAAHLARHAPAGVRIALAGRSLERLERVRSQLPAAAQDWPLHVVDVSDEEAVAELAASTTVVLTTVGPYAVHGLPLVRACAEAGTHYADLTGEVLFVHASIAAVHETASRTNARIVHACGFDSVPSDLGLLLALTAARDRGQGRPVDVRMHLLSSRGGVSGGTVDSLRQQMAAVRSDPSARRVVGDPDALAVARTAYGRDAAPVGRDRATGRWYGPFVMAPFNSRVVRRTWSLLEGDAPLVYDEVVDTGRGRRGAAAAWAVAAGSAALVAGMATRPTRALLDRLLPAPGEGPSERTRRAGHFATRTVVTTTTGDRLAVRVAAPFDPGYDGTAVMLGETGLALAAGEGSERVGVLTPATALGEALAERLRARRFTVEVEPAGEQGPAAPVGG